jgi:hypothetical protein
MPIDCFGARLPLEAASASFDLAPLEAPDVIAERRFPPPRGERTFDGAASMSVTVAKEMEA